MADQSSKGDEKKKKEKVKLSSAKKRHLQSLKRQARNRSFKATVNTAIRGYQDALAAKQESVAQEKLSLVYSLLDKGVKTNRVKLNKAARTKSRLCQKQALL